MCVISYVLISAIIFAQAVCFRMMNTQENHGKQTLRIMPNTMLCLPFLVTKYPRKLEIFKPARTQGSSYYQPKQCILKGKCPKITIGLHCFIPIWVPFNDFWHIPTALPAGYTPSPTLSSPTHHMHPPTPWPHLQ